MNEWGTASRSLFKVEAPLQLWRSIAVLSAHPLAQEKNCVQIGVTCFFPVLLLQLLRGKEGRSKGVFSMALLNAIFYHNLQRGTENAVSWWNNAAYKDCCEKGSMGEEEALKDAPGSEKTARSWFFCLGNSRLLIALLQGAGSTCHIRLVLRDVCLVPESGGTAWGWLCAEQQNRLPKRLSNAPSNPAWRLCVNFLAVIFNLASVLKASLGWEWAFSGVLPHTKLNWFASSFLTKGGGNNAVFVLCGAGPPAHRPGYIYVITARIESGLRAKPLKTAWWGEQ